MAFAEIALGQIRALRQPASPRHFEIWYTYATGYNPSLNQTINETLTRNGTLSEADIDQIYETYLSPQPLHRPHRQRRLAGHGRDRAGHGDDRRRRRLCHRTTPKVSPTVTPEPRRCRRRAGLRAIVESLVQRHQGDGGEQPGAGSAAVGLQAGNQPAAGKSRGGAHREPDRSAHLARQPQVLRRRAGQGDRGRAAPRASRCR